jgi:hypothetical protein
MTAMTDPFTETFSSLDDFYPGSRHKRRTEIEEPSKPTAVTVGWDSKPQIKKVHGKSIEMFTIGALAQAIGKSEGTIRTYQSKGYLPNTPYRLPTQMVNGAPRAGRRLFTRSMVEAAVTAFGKRDLIDAPRVEWKHHRDLSLEVAQAWKQIQDDLANS